MGCQQNWNQMLSLSYIKKYKKMLRLKLSLIYAKRLLQSLISGTGEKHLQLPKQSDTETILEEETKIEPEIKTENTPEDDFWSGRDTSPILSTKLESNAESLLHTEVQQNVEPKIKYDFHKEASPEFDFWARKETSPVLLKESDTATKSEEERKIEVEVKKDNSSEVDFWAGGDTSPNMSKKLESNIES